MENSTNNKQEIKTDLSDNDIWSVIYSYFDDLNNKNYYITKHHLDSYNNFVLNKIPQTFKENNPQTI